MFSIEMSSEHLILLAVVTFLFLLTMKHWRKMDRNKSLLPPGPRKIPILGNLHQLGDLPHRSLHRLSKQYGELMFLQLGSIPTLIVSSADAAREILKSHDLAFSGRPVLYVANRLSYNCSNVSFAPYGEHWRELRKIMIVELLTAKRVRSFEEIRDEEIGNMIDRIADDDNGGGGVNLSEATLSLTNKIVCRVAFGKRRSSGGGGDREGEFLEILHETQQLLGTVSIADFFPGLEWLNKFNGLETRLEKNFRRLDDFYNEVIEEHEAIADNSTEHEDVVGVMLRLQKDPNQAIKLKNEHIKGVLADIFVAGSDTSAAAVVWTMAELIKNPMLMEKAQKEVREVVKGKGKVEASDVPKLMYLKMVIKESLRLHPPVPLMIPRETIEKCTVQGYTIPEKTRVFMNATAISMDEKYWKDPSEVQPERFSDSPVDFRGQHFEFIPFGAGRRGCPGINFAIPLIELALANLLYRFDWRLPEGMQPNDLDMEEALGLTIHKKTPLQLQAIPRLLQL